MAHPLSGLVPRSRRNTGAGQRISTAIGTAHSISLWLAYTLEAAIEGAETLECDRELVKRFEKCIERLPDYPLHGDSEPIVVDVQGAPPIEYNIAVPATPGLSRRCRHMDVLSQGKRTLYAHDRWFAMEWQQLHRNLGGSAVHVWGCRELRSGCAPKWMPALVPMER